MGNFKKILTKCAAATVMSIAVISCSALSVIAAGKSDNDSQETQIELPEDCIVDEIGWIEDKDKLLEGLEQFYHTTGCQPYVF